MLFVSLEYLRLWELTIKKSCNSFFINFHCCRQMSSLTIGSSRFVILLLQWLKTLDLNLVNEQLLVYWIDSLEKIFRLISLLRAQWHFPDGYSSDWNISDGLTFTQYPLHSFEPPPVSPKMETCCTFTSFEGMQQRETPFNGTPRMKVIILLFRVDFTSSQKIRTRNGW